jgi:predicted transcriptional regulator
MQIEDIENETDVGGVPDNIEFLTSSHNRVVVLRALAEGVAEPTELRRNLDMPRSTFRRVLSELQERRYVEKKGRGYVATPLGEYVEEYFSEYIDKMGTVEKLSEFYEHVPPSEIDVEIETVAESDLVLSESFNPHAPVERFLEALDDGDTLKGLAPVVSNVYTEAYQKALLEDSDDSEVVFSRKIAEALLARQEEMFEYVMETCLTQSYVYDGEFTLGLAIIDGEVFIGSYDNDGIMRGLLENDTDEMLTWAEEYYESHKQEVEPFESYL